MAATVTGEWYREWQALRAEHARLEDDYARVHAQEPANTPAHAALKTRLRQHREKLRA